MFYVIRPRSGFGRAPLLFILWLLASNPVSPTKAQTLEIPAVGQRASIIASNVAPDAILQNTGATPVPRIGKHQVLELIFTAATKPVNPFDTYLLKLEVTDPTGRRLKVDGFYDGDENRGQAGQIWKARLCPYRIGRWTWRTMTGDGPDSGLANLGGQFECVNSGDPGGLIAEGKYFRMQDGDFFFPVGSFLDKAGGLPLWSNFGETVTDAQRDAIIGRHRDFHTANKYMLYLANHSDASEICSEVVTPWVGTADKSDKSKMDLRRWHLYDGYLRRMKENGLSAYMSFFEDGKPGNYGRLPMADRKRLLRYAMARTSAFSHMWYVLCFEWQEAWRKMEVKEAGQFLQAHNPWNRLLSIHDWEGKPWAFAGETWPTFIASQDGNKADPDVVNRYLAGLRVHKLPVLADEFGGNRTNSETKVRSKLWAAFCAGAAGTGTGTDLKAFQRFLSQSRIPFQRMEPHNELVEGGGSLRFCLSESHHHCLVYSTASSFRLAVTGTGLKGCWFNPREPNASLGPSFTVSGGLETFTPPENRGDWVLWITDGSNLNSGINRIPTDATLVQMVAKSPGPN